MTETEGRPPASHGETPQNDLLDGSGDSVYRPVDPLYEERLRGWAEGWDAREPEVRRLSDLADRLYLLAWNTPEQIAEIRRRQLDRHFERLDAAFLGRGRA